MSRRALHTERTAGWAKKPWLRDGPMPEMIQPMSYIERMEGWFTAEEFESLELAVGACQRRIKFGYAPSNATLHIDPYFPGYIVVTGSVERYPVERVLGDKLSAFRNDLHGLTNPELPFHPRKDERVRARDFTALMLEGSLQDPSVTWTARDFKPLERLWKKLDVDDVYRAVYRTKHPGVVLLPGVQPVSQVRSKKFKIASSLLISAREVGDPFVSRGTPNNNRGMILV